jgi:hypothetical protein
MDDELKIICMLDVLGFENLHNSFGLSRLRDYYKELTEYVKEQEGGIGIQPIPDGRVAVGWLVVGNAYFSDTLLFWTNYNKISLPSFTKIISECLCFGIEHKLPLRGAISVGQAILDSETNTYLGQPIIEAARTEKLQNWIGVSFGRSFTQPDFNNGFYLDTVLPYKSHYKDSSSPLATGMTVDWARRWRETRKTNLSELISSLDTVPEYSEYYKRTIDFVKFSEENHDWFKTKPHINYG